ncbi:MAG: glycosyltransferase [Methanosarcinales archaeon]|nr:glycosyltransferase [Methanosarcinales archaeon]
MIHALGKYWNCEGYDIADNYDWDRILLCSIVFICVPTPSDMNGRLDCSFVDEVLNKLKIAEYKGIAVIKSTLKIGYMSEAERCYPHLRLAYMPEFLRENNSFSWCEAPDRIVISENEEIISSVLSYFYWLDNVPILKMKHIEAEIGKIAHNAYIASKVSFTNSIEIISTVCEADPIQVMSTIWADRRVVTNAHLVPGLGGYSGKCIPKDTSELNVFQKEIGINLGLFDEIEAVNRQVPPSASQQTAQVHVIIPTAQQDDLIKRALDSVTKQSILPSSVLIVYDETFGLGETLKKIVGNCKSQHRDLRVFLIPNNRIQNLAGAVNAGIEYLIKYFCISDSDYVAILDDDDYWDFRYLQNCLSFSTDVDCDWVISGIIRHDSEYPAGIKQKIPRTFVQNDFLIGNPNIQGSNLFVKISKLNEAGGFSEELVSTTDRDVCIKLLDLKCIKFGFLRNHMVHHDCLSRGDRLSSKGSERKIDGLRIFFNKYKNHMTDDEKSLFVDRSIHLFGASHGTFSAEPEK